MVAVLAESAILRVACGLGHDLAGHGADVRVVQAGDRLGFPLEPLAEIGIVGHMRQEHFDGDGAVQARVGGFVDLTQDPRAERGLDRKGSPGPD